MQQLRHVESTRDSSSNCCTTKLTLFHTQQKMPDFISFLRGFKARFLSNFFFLQAVALKNLKDFFENSDPTFDLFQPFLRYFDDNFWSFRLLERFCNTIHSTWNIIELLSILFPDLSATMSHLQLVLNFFEHFYLCQSLLCSFLGPSIFLTISFLLSSYSILDPFRRFLIMPKMFSFQAKLQCRENCRGSLKYLIQKTIFEMSFVHIF